MPFLVYFLLILFVGLAFYFCIMYLGNEATNLTFDLVHSKQLEPKE